MRRALGRWLNPTALVLVGLCFVLPFVTVSCETPGGYGRAAPGGTTTYNGIDLAIGGEPAVTPADKVRPMPAGFDDRVFLPAATVVLLLLVAGIVVALTLSDRRLRRASLAALAGAAATALLSGQALVEAELAVRVADQLTQPLPAGRSARSYVQTGPGFVGALALLVIVTVANTVGWIRLARRRAALVATDGVAPDVASDGDADTVRHS